MRRLPRLSFLFCLIASLSASSPAGRPSLNQRVFDKAWSLVADRYWDRSMGGNDWAAIRDQYYPKAMAARDEKQLYAVVNKMLDQLDDSHVYATSPSDLRWSRETPEHRDLPAARRLVHIDGGILLIGFDRFDEPLPHHTGLSLNLFQSDWRHRSVPPDCVRECLRVRGDPDL